MNANNVLFCGVRPNRYDEIVQLLIFRSGVLNGHSVAWNCFAFTRFLIKHYRSGTIKCSYGGVVAVR